MAPSVRTFESASADETESIGATLAAELEPGDVVAVSGELGTGKTTLIRGACRALGVSDPVTSPTFTIGQRYRGDVLVSHLDLYRLEDPSAEEPGLLDDYLTPDAIAFVEWPGAAAALAPAAKVEIAFTAGGEAGDNRRVTISR